MSRYHGITDKTYRSFVIDSGEIRTGYVPGGAAGTRLGATKGGAKFVITQTIKDMVVDGAKYPVKGGRRITKGDAKLEVNFIEFSPELIKMALPGSTSTAFPVNASTHKLIKRALKIALADYGTSISILGEVSGSDHPIVCTIDNPLADGNFEISAADESESILKVQFTAHQLPTDLDTEPWSVYFPTDIATTEGA